MEYYYSIHNIYCRVYPFSEYDKQLLMELDQQMDGYFSVVRGSDFSEKTVIVMSGTNEKIVYEDVKIDLNILIEINRIWKILFTNYKEAIVEWQDILDRYLILLDNNAGLYRIKGDKDCYVILTDINKSIQQWYKIHLSLEYLSTYLLSFNNSVFFHSSCAGLNEDNCFLFVGKSEYGKSTIASLFSNQGGFVVNDEKNLIVKNQGLYYVRSGQLKRTSMKKIFSYINTGILKNIYFIHKSSSTYIEQTNESPQLLYKNIKNANLQIGGCPINFPSINKGIISNFINDLVYDIPIFDLYFTRYFCVKDFFGNL